MCCSAGDCDEAQFGRWLRSRGQPHLLQGEHGHATGRREKDLRPAAQQSQPATGSISGSFFLFFSLCLFLFKNCVNEL